MRKPLFILAVLLFPLAAFVMSTPIVVATGQATGLAGTASSFHTTLTWNAVSDADAYKVYASKTSTTYPTSYALAATVQQAYSDGADQVNVATGTYTNGGALSSPAVQSIAADAAHPLITIVRFSISPNGSPACGTISARVATADYTLAGGTWNTAKEVAGISFVPTGGSASDVPTDVTIDLTLGTVSFSGGTGWTPGTITYTGVAGAASAYSGAARVGANGAYVQVSATNANCLIKTDTANPYGGGNMYTSSAGTYTSVAGTDFYHLRVQRSAGTATAPSKLLGGLVFAAVYHFRVVAASLATGDATPSDDLPVTMPDNGIALEETYAATVGAPGGSSCGTTSGVSVTAGHDYIVTIGANVGNGVQSVNGGTTGQYFAATSGGALTGVNAASGSTLINFQSPSAIAWTVYFTAVNTETITYSCTVNGDQTTWTSTTDCARLAGCVGALALGGVTGWVFDAQLTKQSEAGVLSGCTSCPEATKSPTTTQFTWTPMNPAQSLANGTGTLASTNKQLDMAQSFTPNAAIGAYLAQASFLVQQQTVTACTSSWSVSVVNVLQHPWSTSAELANVTASFTKSAAGGGTSIVLADFVNGTLTSNTALITFGITTKSAFGSTVTSVGAFAPFVSTSVSSAYYLRSRVWGGTCDLTMISSIGETTASTYAGGDIWTNDGTGWTERASEDANILDIRAYGGTSTTFSRSAVVADAGGAFYVYTCEVSRDAAPQSYNFTSSFGGRAKPTSFQAAGSSICAGTASGTQATIQEWRLGYDAIPRNASATLSFALDTAGSSRNLLYWGTFAGTQPAHPHVVGPANFTATAGTIGAYDLLTTDDFFTQLNFTVKECANTDCTTYGNTSTTANYLVTICPGAFQRQTSGSVDSNGNLSVTGQDIPGCTVSITLTGTGYSSTTWTNSIGSAGTYTFTVGVFFTTTSGGSFSLGALTITWSGNFTRITPDALNISANRTRPDDLFIDCVRLDPVTGAVRSSCTVDEWSPTDSNTYERSPGTPGFAYPQSVRINTTSQDAGTYVVFVVNATGYWMGDHAFCFGATWASVTACNATIGSDLRAQLAVDTLNEVTAAQRDLANAKAAVSEVTVRQHWLDVLDFALAPFADCSGTVIAGAANEPGCTVPNIAWWYLGTLIVGGAGVSRGRRQ